MCGEKRFFDGLRPISKRIVTLADGRQTEAEAIGTGVLICNDKDGHETKVTLSGVLYIPGLESNLVSVSKMTQKGAVVTFSGTKCYITKQGRQAAVAIKRDGLYYLQQPKRETAGTVRSVETRKKQPEVVMLEFGIPLNDATFYMQAGGVLSCVKEEKESTKDLDKLQIKEERTFGSILGDSQQSSFYNVENDDGDGWVKVTGRRRKLSVESSGNRRDLGPHHRGSR